MVISSPLEVTHRESLSPSSPGIVSGSPGLTPSLCGSVPNHEGGMRLWDQQTLSLNLCAVGTKPGHCLYHFDLSHRRR